MGVIKAWSEGVKEFGYDGVSIEPAGIKVGVNYASFGTLNYVVLDLLATHRAYIINTHHNIMRRQFEAINKAECKAHQRGLPYTRPFPAQVEAEQITQLSQTLVKNIKDTFDKGIDVHIDGQPSDQKALAHKERSVQRDKTSASSTLSWMTLPIYWDPMASRSRVLIPSILFLRRSSLRLMQLLPMSISMLKLSMTCVLFITI
jgi:hypothetical protein